MKQTSLALALCLALAACGKSTPPPSPPQQPPPALGACIKTGCSGTICAEPGKEEITTCEYEAVHGCYQQATCERQADGSCGWTQTADLTACLANPPSM